MERICTDTARDIFKTTLYCNCIFRDSLNLIGDSVDLIPVGIEFQILGPLTLSNFKA